MRPVIGPILPLALPRGRRTSSSFLLLLLYLSPLFPILLFSCAAIDPGKTTGTCFESPVLLILCGGRLD